jgi:hypothetical protein
MGVIKWYCTISLSVFEEEGFKRYCTNSLSLFLRKGAVQCYCTNRHIFVFEKGGFKIVLY